MWYWFGSYINISFFKQSCNMADKAVSGVGSPVLLITIKIRIIVPKSFGLQWLDKRFSFGLWVLGVDLPSLHALSLFSSQGFLFSSPLKSNFCPQVKMLQSRIEEEWMGVVGQSLKDNKRLCDPSTPKPFFCKLPRNLLQSWPCSNHSRKRSVLSRM